MNKVESQELLATNKIGALEQKVFSDSTINRISLYFYPKGDVFSKNPKCDGSINFKTGQTEGTQRFKGSSISEVVNKMQDFLESL